jgi:hypothetical protein
MPIRYGGANWGDSDETQKLPGPRSSSRDASTMPWAQLTACTSPCLGPGECLVDDVYVAQVGYTNLVRNSDFESGKHPGPSSAITAPRRLNVTVPRAGRVAFTCEDRATGIPAPTASRTSCTGHCRKTRTRPSMRKSAGWRVGPKSSSDFMATAGISRPACPFPRTGHPRPSKQPQVR